MISVDIKVHYYNASVIKYFIEGITLLYKINSPTFK